MISGCKTQQKASNLNNDDVYYKKPEASKPVAEGTMITEDLSAPKNIVYDSSSLQKPGSSTFSDDYNDYSSRINRFSHAEKDHGYYDEIYSNSDTTESNSNVNIYLGGGGYSYYDPFFHLDLAGVILIMDIILLITTGITRGDGLIIIIREATGADIMMDITPVIGMVIMDIPIILILITTIHIMAGEIW